MVKRRISAAQRAILINRLKKARAAKKRKSAPTRKKAKSSTKRRYTNMVKRKAPVRRRRKRAGNLSGLMATGVGIGGYILFESMIEPRLISMANITNPLMINAAELMAGVYFSKKSGVIGRVGKAAVVVNLYQLLHPYLSGMGKTSDGVGLFN